MANINKQNVSKAELALQMAHKDMLSFGKLFLADDFMRSETPWFHYEIADDIMNHDKKQLAIIMPRGHGKTVLTKCDILWSFCFAKKDDPLFYGWVSATQKLASGNMDYIKSHLEFNDKIQYYFGNQKGRKWTEEDIELKNGCKLLSKSNVSGIRGGAKLHKRYDLIILDDFEDENNTLTPEARSKNGNLITAVVYPALEPHTGRLRINGTPVHFDSFINNLITNSEKAKKDKKDFAWDVKLYKAIDKKGNSLWDSWFPVTKLEEKKRFYRDSGMPAKFYQEYMMEVQSEEDSVFNSRHIKYWEGHYEWNNDHQISYIWHDDQMKPVQVFVGVDPATDVNRRDSDYSVLMVVAVDMDNSVYVIDYIRERGLPVMSILGEGKLGIVDHMFELAHKYHPNLMVVEDTTMSRPIFQSLKSEAMRRNDFSVKWKEEKPGTRMTKRDRIQGILSQRFAVGQIFIKKNHYDLHHEIVTFGNRMAHDDVIDALAYAVKYASPPQSLVKENGIYLRKSKFRPKSWTLA
jgi:hypothetical protein